MSKDRTHMLSDLVDTILGHGKEIKQQQPGFPMEGHTTQGLVNTIGMH